MDTSALQICHGGKFTLIDFKVGQLLVVQFPTNATQNLGTSTYQKDIFSPIHVKATLQ